MALARQIPHFAGATKGRVFCHALGANKQEKRTDCFFGCRRKLRSCEI